jgi:hypothetical protein
MTLESSNYIDHNSEPELDSDDDQIFGFLPLETPKIASLYHSKNIKK